MFTNLNMLKIMLAEKSGVLRPWDASSNPACFKQIQSHLLSTVLYTKDKKPIKMKKDSHAHQCHKNTQKKKSPADHWGLGWRCGERLSVFPCVWSRSGTALAAFGWVLLEWQSKGGKDEKASRCFNKGEIIISAIIVPLLKMLIRHITACLQCHM